MMPGHGANSGHLRDTALITAVMLNELESFGIQATVACLFVDTRGFTKGDREK